MEAIEVSKQINKMIEMLSIGRRLIKDRAKSKATQISNYEKMIAITILKLKNGHIPEFEGEKIENLPATLIEKVARGICWREKMEADLSADEYKAAVVGMDSLKAELNGYQSISRHLEHNPS